MLTNEIHPGNGGLEMGSDTSTGLTGGMYAVNLDLFGQPFSKAPSALASIPAHFLESANSFDLGAERDGSFNANRTRIRSNASIFAYEDEFESGIPPIDFATRQIDRMFDATESWTDGANNETYFDNFLHSARLDNGSRLDRSFVGVIDTGFQAEDHGTQVVNAIEQVGSQSLDWVADGVGSGTWSESLVKFVDAAKASGHSNAVINLSFDLTQINRDASISTRFELTTAERAALKYAQVNGVLAVVSAGNQGGAMSALGRASQEFDNVIAVGATEGDQRADYSSYGAGLDFVASGGGQGTSLAAAEVTGSIARIWDANPQLDYRQVTQTLEATATDLEQPGWDAETGYGRLNLSAAIALAERLSSQPQGSWNFPVLQNLSEKNQINQASQDVLVWQQSNDAISSERPNAASYPGYSLKFNPSAPEYNEDKAVVKLWQQRMKDLGYNLKVDGSYGQQSVNVARQFQQAKGLDVDGVVGSKTWAASFSPGTPVAGSERSPDRGMSADAARWAAQADLANNAASYPGYSLKFNPSAPEYNEDKAVVKLWQQRMKDLGYNLKVDGSYGQQSVNVARQFQQAKGLDVDGIVGPQTWAASFSTTNVTGSPISTRPSTSGMAGNSLSGSAQQMLDVARSFIGVREQGGNNRGAQVEKFQKAVDGLAQGEPWCMSFAQYCIKAAESATQTNSQVAQSEGCLTVWEKSPKELRSSKPEPGSLVIWQYGNSRNGHVGIVETVNSDGTFTTIEGNTSSGSGINREGDGVYRKQRDLDGEGSMRVVGFLKVFPDVASDVNKSSPSQGGSADATERRSQTELANNAASYPGYSLKFNPSAPEYTENPAVVKLWQQRMKDLGYALNVDGKYGQQSVNVARQFQQAKGLDVDGIVGSKTWAATFSLGARTAMSETSPDRGMSADAARWAAQADARRERSPSRGMSADATERWAQIKRADNASSNNAPKLNQGSLPSPVQQSINFVEDLGIGTGEAVADMAKDIWSTVVEGGDYARDLVFNQEEARQTEKNVRDTAKSIVDNPEQVWDAIKEPYVEDWNNGDYGRAIGRGIVEIGSSFIPGAGVAATAIKATKATRLGNVLGNDRGSIQFLPDEPVSWEASTFGPNWWGTRVPRSFDLKVDGVTYHVHPNATKHMNEYVYSPKNHDGSGEFPISSLAAAVKQAQSQGLKPGRNQPTIADWELGIDTSDNTIYHARYLKSHRGRDPIN